MHRGFSWLAEQQDVLYAQDRWALLLVFQAMDAAGKDGTIKHLASGINPQGCEVTRSNSRRRRNSTTISMAPHQHVPARGQIGIFNRSYYEEVLVVKVHPEILAREKLPPSLVTNDIWAERNEDIASFERYLRATGADSEVLPARIEKGAETAFPGAARRAGEELEIPVRRRASARIGTDYTHAYEEAIRKRRRNTRRGTWFPPTTNGSRARRRRGDQGDRRSGPDLPEDQRRGEDGTGRRACAALSRER